MIPILMACGPNDLLIPCRIFGTIEEARERCEEILGVKAVYDEDDDSYFYPKCIEGAEDDDISKQLFTKWYYGCGFPDGFLLKEVEFDEAFVPFDLD